MHVDGTVGSGLRYKNNEEIFQLPSSSLIYYIVVASNHTETTNRPYFCVCSSDNINGGIQFFTDTNIIRFKVLNSQDDTEYFSIEENSLKYNVYAIKFNEFHEKLANTSIYINGKHIRTFNDIEVNYYAKVIITRQNAKKISSNWFGSLY